MNIYFSGSIAGGRSDLPVYQHIVRRLQESGCRVPSAHVADPDVLAQEADLTERAIYERDAAWVRACDALVAEVSTPSLGVGYEIALAAQLGKPILCLHREGLFVSRMITGNPGVQVKTYTTLAEIEAHLAQFLNERVGQVDNLSHAGQFVSAPGP